MIKRRPDHRDCSVARTLDIVGDRWTFLILREAFFGIRYYDQFRANLGIATNILSERLKALVRDGILERRQDQQDARRVQYRFTEMGLDLYPITLALMRWGDKWLAGGKGPPLILHHNTCSHELTPLMCCAHCRQPVEARQVSYKSRDREESPRLSLE